MTYDICPGTQLREKTKNRCDAVVQKPINGLGFGAPGFGLRFDLRLVGCSDE